MPGMIIDKFNIYSDDYIQLVGVIDYIVVILALAIVSLQRIMDIGRLWLYIVVWIGIILYFLYNPFDISENVITVTRNVDSIETIRAEGYLTTHPDTSATQWTNKGNGRDYIVEEENGKYKILFDQGWKDITKYDLERYYKRKSN